MVMRSPRPQRVQRPPSGQRTPSRYSRGVTALPARRGGAPGGDAAAGGDSPAVLAPRRAAQGCGKARRAALRIAGKPLPRSRAHPWFCWPIRPPIYLHETVTSPDSRLPREPDAVAELAQHDGARETERSVGHRHSRGGIWRTEAIAIISIIIFPCARRDTLERPRRAFGQPGLERLPGGILCLAQASRPRGHICGRCHHRLPAFLPAARWGPERTSQWPRRFRRDTACRQPAGPSATECRAQPPKPQSRPAWRLPWPLPFPAEHVAQQAAELPVAPWPARCAHNRAPKWDETRRAV